MTSTAPPPLALRLHALVDTLTIGVRTDPGGRAFLTPRGELVHGCTETLAKALAELPPGVVRVDLDMSRVTFMDTTGLEFLRALDEHGRSHLVEVTATGWAGQPRRVLELAALDTADPLRPPPDGRAHPQPESLTGSAVALERVERLLRLREEVEQLREAMVTRPVIDQARGILMAAHSCTPEQAWDILREASQRSNTKLRAVAAAVTAGAVPDGPAPPEGIRTALRTAISRATGPDAPRPPAAPRPSPTSKPPPTPFPRAASGRRPRTGSAPRPGVPGLRVTVPVPEESPGAPGVTTMREHTPSQAEGERDDAGTRRTAEPPDTPYPTPSQAEGDRDDLPDTADPADDDA
ncbi:ANTAR domain-containing response regulator [Streptomyces anandii]|uniref:ANTAR domain-containing response regulator n=2 Tax=Streptomyces anandii TaxID=285454 RepID=UPI0036BE3508